MSVHLRRRAPPTYRRRIGLYQAMADLAPHIDQHAGKSGAQVGNDLADEGFDLARRGRWCKLGHDLVPLREERPLAPHRPLIVPKRPTRHEAAVFCAA